MNQKPSPSLELALRDLAPAAHHHLGQRRDIGRTLDHNA
jgi:hypothetical protein